MEIIKEMPWSRIKGQNSVNKEVQEIVDTGKANGQFSRGHNCSFRHDMNKRAKLTRSNLSPSSSTQQSGKNASRTRSPWGRSPSGRMFRLLCKDFFRETFTTPFCEKWHPPEWLFCKSENGCRFGEKVLSCAPSGWTAQQKFWKRMVTKVQWLCWNVLDNSVAYFRIWSQSLCGGAQTYGNQSDV